MNRVRTMLPDGCATRMRPGRLASRLSCRKLTVGGRRSAGIAAGGRSGQPQPATTRLPQSPRSGPPGDPATATRVVIHPGQRSHRTARTCTTGWTWVCTPGATVHKGERRCWSVNFGCIARQAGACSPRSHRRWCSRRAPGIRRSSRCLTRRSSETSRGRRVVLDLLLIAALRGWFAGPAGGGPAWHRAQADPVMGRAQRMLHDDRARPWTVATLSAEGGVSRANLARRFIARRRAADGLPDGLAARARRRPAPGARGHGRLGRGVSDTAARSR